MNHSLSKTLAVLGVALINVPAQAATTWVGTANYGVETVGDFDSYDFGVGVVLLEASTGSGTPSNPSVNDVYNGYLQTYVSGHSLGGTGVADSLNATGTGTGYELTLRANFQETITNVTGSNVDFTVDSGSVQMYLDLNPNYSFVGDTGFDDGGTPILAGNIIGGSGTFFDGRLGVTSIDIEITGYDYGVFEPDTIIAGSSVFTLQLVDGVTDFGDPSSVHGQSVDFNAGDILLSADGNLSLQAVPVPAAVWLFGTGLLGLLGMARRRS